MIKILKNWQGLAFVSLLLLVAAVDLTVPEENTKTRLQQVREEGTLVMLSRNGASSYFLGANGETGPEYELASAFAEYLGVDLKVRIAESYGELSVMLKDGKGHLIAANMTRTPEREQQFRFGPDYASTATLVVYHRELAQPRTLADLAGKNVAVIGGSLYEAQLQAAAQSLPGLEFETWDSAAIEDLLLAIDEGDIDATLIDERIFSINQHYYPDVRNAFALPENLPQAWAFERDHDDSLVQAANAFMSRAETGAILAAIDQEFFSEEAQLDQVGMFHFVRKVRDRLPSYLDTFQAVAAENDVDWRLLAAVGYQESHWDEDAASPTGVRGLMMLTRVTASQMGLDDRLDPDQSIDGGARYFLHMMDKLPARIPQPDRTWMALAAYNVGFGHLEDARVLAQKMGGNPDRWEDVSAALPLLTQEKYYRNARYGYARGNQAQRYVRNIRSYYDILTWMDTRDHPLIAQASGLAP